MLNYQFPYINKKLSLTKKTPLCSHKFYNGLVKRISKLGYEVSLEPTAA